MAEKKTVEKKESKYSRDELIANSEQVFKVKPEVVIGALYGKKQKEFTKLEVETEIKNFLKRKVQ